MHDSFAEGKKKEEFLLLAIDSGARFDVNPRQKCHLDESLLVQAGVARRRQKGEFHADQINTDVK